MVSRRLLAGSLVVLALAAGCGGASSTAGSASRAARAATASFPATVEADNGRVALERRPTRIVSLSPTATEMLFAIGAGDQVVAVDDQSNYPRKAPTTKLSGYQPNVEAIAGYRPDLVVASNDPGGLVRSLAALHVPVLLEGAAARLSDTYRQLRTLGTATGHEREAGTVVARMRAEIARVVASVPRPTRPITFYHELDDSYFSATSGTFIGQIYSLLGLTDIADKAKGAGSAYPQLSAEYIVAANPDIIFLADTKCCRQSAATVARRPGWGRIAAVRNGQVVAVDDDVASRWGPRIVQLLRIAAEHVQAVEQAS